MKRCFLSALLFLFAFSIEARNYEIICLTGRCFTERNPSVMLAVGDEISESDIIVVEEDCVLILQDSGTGKKYRLDRLSANSDTLGSVLACAAEENMMAGLDVKTEMRYGRRISSDSGVASKRGSSNDADYTVGKAVVSKCIDDTFSVDSLYKVYSDYLIVLDYDCVDGYEVITVSNYDASDSLYVALYGIDRKSGELYLDQVGDMWTFALPPMTEYVFSVADFSRKKYYGFFAVADKSDFNYVDTFYILDSAEGNSTVRIGNRQVGFSIVNN